MPKPSDFAPLPDFDAMLQVVSRFEAARAGNPRMKEAELGELLRLDPGKRAVVEGVVGDRPAVFRIFLEDGNSMPAREWAELQRIWPFMNDGRYRVVEPLLTDSAHGIVAVERVEGTPMLKHIWQSDPDTRADLLEPAAAWLRRYTRNSETERPDGSEGWLARARRAAARQPFRKLARLERGILVELERLSAAMTNSTWRYAISHGDFHPNNLILNGTRLTGIDTGGSASTPIYKDMARFLAHMGRRGVIPSGDRYLGVDRGGMAAFSKAFALSDVEAGLILPFMIGCEALLRVEHPGLKRGRIRRAQEMYTLLLQDLQAISAP